MVRPISAVSLALFLLAAVDNLPARADDVCSLADTAVFAFNSVFVKRDSIITGDVVVNDASAGPTLAPGFEAQVDQGGAVFGALKADSVRLGKSATIDTVETNELSQGKATVNTLVTPLSLPVLSAVPPFVEASFRGTPTDVFVGVGALFTLDAGDYGVVEIGAGGTLILPGGTYNLVSLTGGASSSVLFAGRTEVRVRDTFQMGNGAVSSPAVGAPVGAADVVLYVGGANATPGDPLSVPAAVQFGQGSRIEANLYAARGTISVGQVSQVTGALFARDVLLERGASVLAASAFRNRPPVAQPQAVSTFGAPIEITLRGSDPEFQSLTFGIASHPALGSLGPLSHIVPPLVEDPQNPGQFVQPPVTSATVTYTPPEPPPSDPQTAFTFSVTDTCGAVGMAPVDINRPGDPTPPPPELQTVVAYDQSVETLEDTAVTIVLRAEAPPGTESNLEFSIVADPASGAVTHPPDPGAEVPTRSASVTYTPDFGFLGTDQFTFEACDNAGAAPVCDQGVVSIVVSAAPPLAVDQEILVESGVPAKIDLGAGIPGSSLRLAPRPPTKVLLRPKAAFLQGADVAGNVADSNDDGLGDNHDPLPGPAPVLVAAAVDVNLGEGSSGSVSDPAGDATDDSRVDPDPDLVSAVVNSDGVDLHLQVRFAAGSFDASLSRASFVLDTDEDPSTGFPGIDAAQNDANLMGHEFLVNIGAALGAQAQVWRFDSLPDNFSVVGTVAATVVANGYDATIPLSLLDGDDGRLAFKVVTQAHLGGGGFTGILDYMPNLGLAPGVGAITGVQGVARVEIEWDLASLASTPSDQLESAQVILHTLKGTVDSLDTVFFVGTEEQDGLLTNTDFEAPAEAIEGVAMPVPAGPTGTEGTFSFDVTPQMRAFLDTVLTKFSIQGRVDESLAGSGFARGLQIRSTAAGNLAGFLEPQLAITTPGVTVPLLFELLTLPQNGSLRDASGAPILSPTTLPSPKLTYLPNAFFQGTDSFQFQVTQGSNFGSAIITLFVVDTCAENGRPPGCGPGFLP